MILFPNNLLNINLKNKNKKDSHLFMLFAAIAPNLIWLQRNKVIHREPPPNSILLVEQAKRLHREHLMVWNSMFSKRLKIEKWPPPP